MSNVKKKAFQRLKRKRIWPSILNFIIFIFVCVVAIIVFMILFVMYIMGTKVVHHSEDVQRVGNVVDALTAGGDSIPEAVDEMQRYILGEQDLYIMDHHGNLLYRTGNSEPNFDIVMEFAMGREFVAVADSKSSFVQQGGFGTIYCIPVEDIFSDVFKPGEPGETLAHWLDKTIISQDYWLRTFLKDREHVIYVKCNIQIKREDIVYVCIFGIIALVFMLVPVLLLFISAIRSIVMQRDMTKLYYSDPVTGGRNWLCFQNNAERILTRPMNSKKAFAMVNLHFVRYRNYCACYGIEAGEGLLQAMDGFLSARVGKNEFCARRERADFGLLICCTGENEEERQENCKKRIWSLFAELAGLKTDQKIRFHAGINMIPPYIPEDGKWYHMRRKVDIDQLYTYAETARMGGNYRNEQRIFFFDEKLLCTQVWERWVEDNMETALRDEQFQVYLQPKYSPSNEKMVGAEALVRWNSTSEGLILPERFISIFESNGFITRLDDYMISRVAKLQAEWTIQGRKIVPVSVNVSRAHFAQEGLAEHICQLVDAYGPSHELIELEVTESAFFEDKDILIETVKQLREYGFRVSMDDFGAGYSSLNSLKDIPLDELKLDGEFFKSDDDGRGKMVIKEAIQLAKHLDMRVVAEGIEEKEQVDFLIGQGCDMIQGMYFAKPMPIVEFEEKVEKEA